MKKEQIGFGSFGKSFQERLAQLILDDASFANQVGEVLDFNFFELKYLQLFVKLIYDYKEKYKKHPNRPSFETVLRNDLKDENEIVQKKIREFFARIVSGNVKSVDEEYIKEKSLDFCRKQKLREAFVKSIDLMDTAEFDEISKLVNEALKLGSDNDVGYQFIDQFEDRYMFKARNPVPTQWDVVDRLIQGGLGSGELGVVIAPTGCHAKGTKLIMFDGSFKKVEDIRVGDILMGPDSKPRLVEQLCRGREKMYEIKPKKGNSFVVNENHILSLKRTQDGTFKSGTIVNLSVKEYLEKSKTFKHIHKLYRVGADFEEKELSIPPYIMGTMLGDGSVCNGNVTFKRDKKNPIMEKMEFYSLRDKRSADKFIPFDYKTSSRQQRLELLAGLMDTDGSLSRGGYDYISKSRKLAEDVAYVARSLGLAAYVSECEKTIRSCDFVGTYFRVYISGECSVIPSKLERKQASKRRQKKNVLMTGFEVFETGTDDFYGFHLSGDHLYLMEDFTVTHNSGKSMVLTAIGAAAVKQGKNVVHYTLELSDETIGLRYDANISGISLGALKPMKDDVFEEIKDIPGKLIIREYPTKSASTETLKNHLERLVQRGFDPDVVIVDYGDLLRPRRYSKEKRNDLETIYEELRALGQHFKCPVWTASQTNRSGLNAEVITMESISEAFSKCFVADFIFSCSRTILDKQSNSGRYFIAKNRFGPDGIICPIHMDTSRVHIEVYEPTGETKEDLEKASAKEQEARLKEKYRLKKEQEKKEKEDNKEE